MKREKRENSGCAPPWADLPQHLLQLISSRLRRADYLNFRSVCVAWRSTAKQHNPYPDYPLLMIRKSPDSRARYLVSASNKELNWCALKICLPEFGQRYCCLGSFYGWLLIRHVHLKHILFLINPFTGVRIDLPPWDVSKSIHRVALSSVPPGPDCVVLLLGYNYSDFVYCRLGDNKWTTEKVEIRKPVDALYLDGKFYVLSHHSSKMKPNSHPKLVILELPELSISGQDLTSYLVECSGEILLILKVGKTLTSEFEVFQLELSALSWTQVESARDHVLFLGPSCSVSLHSTKLGCRGNLIYFTELPFNNLWVYDLEDGTISTRMTTLVKDVGDYHPIWFTPSFV